MTQSNSKLTKDQKEYLRYLLADNPQVNFHFIGDTTIAYEQLENFVEFSTAICSEGEKKFRKSVGKYWAMNRLVNAGGVKLPKDQFDVMIDIM